jgi:N-acetylmuramoyl-L-alanine amidase
MVMAALVAAVFFYTQYLNAAQDGFPIYFENSTLTLKAQELNRVIYIPLLEIVRHLSLPYTDATALETFTIRNQDSRLVLTRNSGLISVNDQIVLLQNPILRENTQWLVPVEFLSAGLSRITGTPFRYRPGTSRVFAGDVTPPELIMNAQALGPLTRLTVRADNPINVNLQRDAGQNRAVLVIDPGPIDPLREALEYRDRLVESIAFDDSDGTPKIVVGTTGEVTEVRLASADERRVYFVDFVREAEITENIPPAALPSPPSALDPNAATASAVRVIVIDPGHGGIDTGVQHSGILEKELTLSIARRLRTALQTRLGATILLTRDSDIALTSEARSAVANNTQADLFISLHIGYSADQAASGASVYVIQEDFAAKLSGDVSGNRMFLPWYLGYRSSRQSSQRIARLLQDELGRAMPGWQFPLRAGPIGVLASATMPAVAVELGNLNNAVNAQTVLDDGFQARLVNTIVAAVGRFAGIPQVGI